MALDAIEEANKEKLEGVFRNINFNSEAALGQTKQRNARLKNLLKRLRRPAPGPAPLPHQRAGHHRQRLRVPDRQVRRRRGQEGRRVLHPARSLAPAGEAARSPARRAHLRPGLRLRLAADQVRRGSRQRRLRPLRAGEQRQHLGAGDDEHVPAQRQPAARSPGATRLDNPMHREGDNLMRFNVVIANPPFSLDKWGDRERRQRPLQALLARRAAQEHGRLCLHLAHDRIDLPGAEPERARGRDRAARRALPWRSRRENPPEADRGEPAGRGDRPARQPVLRHRHPGRDPDLQAQPT